MKNTLQQYREDGFHLARNVFSEGFCDELKAHLETLSPKLYTPFSKVPWGYGNLLGEGPFAKVTTHEGVTTKCQSLLGDNYTFNHLMLNSKAPWIGGAVEWHQEVFNIDSYAPGYTATDWESFMQIYIALDAHSSENGYLKIFPQSHKLGVLECEDIVGDNFGHKRRLTYDAINSAHKKCGVQSVEMDVGDVLFFNHLLIHGSPSNHSPLPRRSIVLQARIDSKPKDEDIFMKETLYRREFTINALSDTITQLQNNNPYTSFRKEKHGNR